MWPNWSPDGLGGLLALGLPPLEFAFWIGFALPLGPVVGAGPNRLGVHGLVVDAPAQGLTTSDTRESPNLIPVAEFNSGAPPALDVTPESFL